MNQTPMSAQQIGLGLVLSLLLGSAAAVPGAAENLYDPAGGELFTRLTAAQVGDVLTVIISESTKAEREVETDTEKSPKYTGGARVEGFFDVLSFLNNTIEPLQALDIDPKEEFQSSAKTGAGGKFTGRMTVIVREVLPNGNLRIEGLRTIEINRETETLSLSGVVRKYDIGPDNTISSSAIADAEIHYTGKGVVSRGQRTGIFSKLFNLIF